MSFMRGSWPRIAWTFPTSGTRPSSTSFARSPSAALPRDHRPRPPAQRLAEVVDVGDQHLLAAPADELDRGVDLRAHRALRELALGPVALGVGDGETVQGLLRRLAEVDRHLGDSGQDDE